MAIIIDEEMIPKDKGGKLIFLKKHLTQGGKLSDFKYKTAQELYYFMLKYANEFNDLVWTKKREGISREELISRAEATRIKKRKMKSEAVKARKQYLKEKSKTA